MNKSEKPIIKGEFIIQKMSGKGGWSYVMLPCTPLTSNLPFGWNVVKGTIDHYEIKQYKLWPSESKQLFLPINAEIRKKIKKDEGNTVFVTLYIDDSELVIPDEFVLCLKENPIADSFFNHLSVTSKKQYIDYVMASKSLETKAKRMSNMIRKLEKGLKYHQKELESE